MHEPYALRKLVMSIEYDLHLWQKMVFFSIIWHCLFSKKVASLFVQKIEASFFEKRLCHMITAEYTLNNA